MTLPMPYLDDRNFEQLLAEAKTVIQRSCPQWSDLSVHDPGVVLLEAFAYLTETLIFRVNRFPERVHAALLNLLGVALDPPAAASTVLRFAWERPGNAAVDIPAGTRVGVSGQSGANAAIFATVTKAKLPADADATVDVPAYHFTPVSSELIGYGSGEGDQILRTAQRPIVNLPGRGSSLRVAVELGVGETAGPAGGITINDAQYEWWPVVADFARFAGSRICRADLVDGAISFAPALDPRDGTAAGPMGAVPAAGRRIIAWYATGGGPDGNVVPGTLTLLKEQIPGVKVTNPEPATGGRAMEDLANAFKRGPQQFRSQNRAVTARDYEVLALRAGASVARAKAFTRAEAWTYAEPGEVEVVLVPNVGSPTGAQTVVSPAELIAHRREGDRELVAAALADSQPLGTRSIVRWANAKTVQVKATVVIRPEEDAAAVQRRVLDRLHRHICPVPAGGEGGWPFGEPLRISNVYRLLEEHEPGIRFVEAVRLVVDSTPDADVASIVADNYQPATWYAASGRDVFRSLDDGEGWELLTSFDGPVTLVEPFPAPPPGRPGFVPRPGSVVAVVRSGDNRCQLWHSSDLGERWDLLVEVGQIVQDVAWSWEQGDIVVYLATTRGLLRLVVAEDAVPEPLIIDPARPELGLYAVVSQLGEDGQVNLAVAAEEGRGVFVSTSTGAGVTRSWVLRPLASHDIRRLLVDYRSPTEAYLWALLFGGEGCARIRLGDTGAVWTVYGQGYGWSDNSTCWSLAVAGDSIVAGTEIGGIRELSLSSANAQWVNVAQGCGLPLRPDRGFVPVHTVGAAARPDGLLVLAGGAQGVHRRYGPRSASFDPAAERESGRQVTIPPTWVFCSGAHDIQVVTR